MCFIETDWFLENPTQLWSGFGPLGTAWWATAFIWLIFLYPNPAEEWEPEMRRRANREENFAVSLDAESSLLGQRELMHRQLETWTSARITTKHKNTGESLWILMTENLGTSAFRGSFYSKGKREVLLSCLYVLASRFQLKGLFIGKDHQAHPSAFFFSFFQG